MATTYYTTLYNNKAGAVSPHGLAKSSVHLHAISGTISTWALNDTIYVGYLPRGAVVVSCILKAASQLDSNGSPTLTLSAGHPGHDHALQERGDDRGPHVGRFGGPHACRRRRALRQPHHGGHSGHRHRERRGRHGCCGNRRGGSGVLHRGRGRHGSVTRRCSLRSADRGGRVSPARPPRLSWLRVQGWLGQARPGAETEIMGPRDKPGDDGGA